MTEFDLHSQPSYYGRNLDDLWECLTSYIDPNIRLIVNDYQGLISTMGAEAEAFKEIFEKLVATCPEMEILLN